MDNSVFESVEYNLELICRVCMQESYNLRSIYNELVQTVPLNEIVMLVVPQIQITPDDGMPNQICEFCLSQVHTAYDFKVKCELSDSLLRGYMMRKSAMASIKEEKPEAEEDDDCQIIPEQMPIKSELALGDEEIGDASGNYGGDNGFYDTPWMGGYDEYAIDGGDDEFNYSVSSHENCDTGGGGGSGKVVPEPFIDYKGARNAEGRYNCQYCEITLADIQGLKYHTRLHTGYGLSRCPYCSKGFTKRSHLSRHMEIHTNKLFKCKSCPETFATVVDLKMHIRNIHERRISKKLSTIFTADLLKPNNVRIAACKVCNVQFSKIKELRAHLQVHLDKQIFGTRITPDQNIIHRFYQIHDSQGTEFQLTDSESEDESYPHECPKCGCLFNRSYKLHQHIHDTHPAFMSALPHQCATCFRTFATESILTRHVRHQCGNSLKKFACNQCNVKFMWESNFALHNKRFHFQAAATDENKNFTCNVCGKSYLIKRTLERHQRIHDPAEKKFECPLCHKKFYRSDYLRPHMMNVHGSSKDDVDRTLWDRRQMK